MGQQEIFIFLRKNRNKWFTAKQLAQKIKTSFGSVIVGLKILRTSKQIKCKLTDSCSVGKRKVFAYKFKK